MRHVLALLMALLPGIALGQSLSPSLISTLGGGLGPTTMVPAPANAVVGTLLGTPPSGSTGLRFYLGSSDSITFSVSPVVPTTKQLTLVNPAYNSAGRYGADMNGGYAYTPLGSSQIASAPFTVEAWVRAPASGQIRVAISQGNLFYMGCRQDSTALFSVNGGQLFTTLPLCDGQFHHIAMVSNATATTFYLDGTLAATGVAVPGGFNYQASRFMIRDFDLGLGLYTWQGDVAEVAIWSVARYTTTFGTNATAYNGGEANLLALYHLNSAVTDASAQVTINQATNGPNWDERLSGNQNIYITGMAGAPVFRWY